jgi:SAM-dependent methyltransferase
MARQEHWDRLYTTKSLDSVSWFSPHLETSLALIERATPDRSTSIIDVGGGASTLVDDLLDRGYRNLCVLDISQLALDIVKKRLGDTFQSIHASQSIHLICADVTEAPLPTHVPAHNYDLWHDRAVFHFLTRSDQRARYANAVTSAVKPGGHVILSTFGAEGPTQCSGLDVMRYDAASLQAELGSRFRLIESSTEWHHTPFGSTQQFLYCHFVLEP